MTRADWLEDLKVFSEDLVPRKCCLPRKSMLLWVWGLLGTTGLAMDRFGGAGAGLQEAAGGGGEGRPCSGPRL